MRLAMRLTMTTLMALTVPLRSSGSLWLKHPISDSLSPNSSSNSSPCAGASGVVWVSQSRCALAFWNRREATYISPLGFRSGPLHPSLWDDAIAFDYAGPGCAEVYLCDAGTPHRITYNSICDAHPSLFGGKIAWDNSPPCCSPWPCEPEDSEIWFWNGYGAWQLTDNEVNDLHPSLYELTVAWVSDGNVVYAIIPDPEWGRPLTPTVVAEGGRLSLYAGKIAYDASDGHDSEIFLYDMESGQILQLTDNEYNDRDPCLYDGTLVWEAYDGNDVEIFYWDGKNVHQLTDNDVYDTDPSVWGTGLNTTIAYVETRREGTWSYRSPIVCLRPAVTASRGPATGDVTLTWPSLEGRTYRVEYSDDLLTWQIAADDLPSAGYGETSWTDDIASGTVTRRFYRVAEKE